MTAQKTALPPQYKELTIVEGPPFHELLLSHSVAIANHIQYGACFGLRIQNRSVYFTTKTKEGAGTARIDFNFITSIEPYESDGGLEYPAHKTGVAFSGLVSFKKEPTILGGSTILKGFYCVYDRTGYILLPIH